LSVSLAQINRSQQVSPLNRPITWKRFWPSAFSSSVRRSQWSLSIVHCSCLKFSAEISVDRAAL